MDQDFRTQTQSKDKKLRYLLLGWDGAAAVAAERLLGLNAEVVVIARSRPRDLPEDAAFLEGDPASADVLRLGGIDQAASVLVTLPLEEARAAVSALKRLTSAARIVASAPDHAAALALLEAGAQKAIDVRAEAAREMVRLMMLAGGDAAREAAR